MDNPAIILNHIGFRSDARKTAYVDLDSTDIFHIERLQDCLFIEVFSGSLISSGDSKDSRRVADFTQLNVEGIYRIRVGNRNSRIFVIQDSLDLHILRTLFNFVTLQSCGSDLGWNGPCHLDDSILLGSGENRSLVGGFHQSSDLRKWSWGISLGMIGLIQFALNQDPLWNKGEIEREIRNGCDFYLRLILDDGSLIDSVFVPVDASGNSLDRHDPEHLAIHGVGYQDYSLLWNRREYYERPTASPAHWFTIRFLCLASRYFSPIDLVFGKECLAGAERIWKFMEEKASSTYNFKIALFPPLGHEPLNKWWTPLYEGSAIELAGRACAGIELAAAKQSEAYDLVIKESLDALCDLQITGTGLLVDGSFWEGNRERLANNYHYFYTTSVPTSLYMAIEELDGRIDTQRWKNALRVIADQYVAIGRTNTFGRIQGTIFTEDVFEQGANFSFSEELADSKPVNYSAGEINGTQFSYKYFSFCYNLDLAAAGIVLKKAATILGDFGYLGAAQNQIDWIMGSNPFDASSIEGLGYNNPHRGVFGEFFPPVPQIPGGVYTGITDQAFTEEAYGLECEYDLPETTWLMHLLSI